MAHIKLKQLLENNSAALANKQIEEELYKELSEAFEHDLKRLEETLISEGFGDIWNKIKQKGSEMAQGAKNALLKPLLKLIIDKIAKSDPQGMAKLVNAAKNNPKAIGGLMNSPQVQAKQKEVSQELKSINEVLTEDEHEELFQEYVDTILREARVLSNDPRNVKRRELAAQRKKAKAAPAPDAAPTPAPEKTPAPKKGKAAPKKPKPDPKQAGPDKNKDQEQGKQQSLIQKVYGFAKKYPKISAVVGVALLGVVAAAVVGSGGVIPLITSTLASSATGALSGGLGGGVISGVKDAGSQYFKSGKVNWKQAGQAALQGAKTGAKYGAISGATGNIAGKAIAGVGKMATWAGNALSAGKGAKDATGNAPETKRNPSMDSQEGGQAANQTYLNQIAQKYKSDIYNSSDKAVKTLQDPANYGYQPGREYYTMGKNIKVGGYDLDKVLNLGMDMDERNMYTNSSGFLKFVKRVAQGEDGDQKAELMLNNMIIKGLGNLEKIK